MQQTKEQTIARWGFYLLGMVLLALGLTLNTKTGLGASAIVSVPFTVSQATGWNFGNLLLGVGLGTLISMVGVGRAIAGFNYLCKRPLLRATGMQA